jgi:hypothetical protein
MFFVQHLLSADDWFFFFPATVPSPSRVRLPFGLLRLLSSRNTRSAEPVSPSEQDSKDIGEIALLFDGRHLQANASGDGGIHVNKQTNIRQFGSGVKYQSSCFCL